MKQSQKMLALLMAAVLCLSLAACGASQKNSSEAQTTTDMAFPSAPGEIGGSGNAGIYPPMAPDVEYAQESTKDTTTGSTTTPVYQNSDVKLIRRASLSIQSTEFDQTVARLEQLVKELDGYFQDSQISSGGYYDRNGSRSGDFTVRIPAERYDEFMEQAGDVGYLLRKSESSEDVGETYYDLEARLKTQRVKQERLLSLMEKAEKMEDIISLESALAEVEYQIEQYSSSLKRYDGLIGYATITLNLYEVVKIVEEPGEKDSLGRKLLAGLGSSVEGLIEGTQDFLIWCSYHVFGLILAAVIAAAVIVTVRRKKTSWKGLRRKKKTEQQEEK